MVVSAGMVIFRGAVVEGERLGQDRGAVGDMLQREVVEVGVVLSGEVVQEEEVVGRKLHGESGRAHREKGGAVYTVAWWEVG